MAACENIENVYVCVCLFLSNSHSLSLFLSLRPDLQDVCQLANHWKQTNVSHQQTLGDTLLVRTRAYYTALLIARVMKSSFRVHGNGCSSKSDRYRRVVWHSFELKIFMYIFILSCSPLCSIPIQFRLIFFKY